MAPGVAGRLLDGLSAADDRLWPKDRWPAMRFDRPLKVGARGGHGPRALHASRTSIPAGA